MSAFLYCRIEKPQNPSLFTRRLRVEAWCIAGLFMEDCHRINPDELELSCVVQTSENFYPKLDENTVLSGFKNKLYSSGFEKFSSDNGLTILSLSLSQGDKLYSCNDDKLEAWPLNIIVEIEIEENLDNFFLSLELEYRGLIAVSNRISVSCCALAGGGNSLLGGGIDVLPPRIFNDVIDLRCWAIPIVGEIKSISCRADLNDKSISILGSSIVGQLESHRLGLEYPDLPNSEDSELNCAVVFPQGVQDDFTLLLEILANGEKKEVLLGHSRLATSNSISEICTVKFGADFLKIEGILASKQVFRQRIYLATTWRVFDIETLGVSIRWFSNPGDVLAFGGISMFDDNRFEINIPRRVLGEYSGSVDLLYKQGSEVLPFNGAPIKEILSASLSNQNPNDSALKSATKLSLSVGRKMLLRVQEMLPLYSKHEVFPRARNSALFISHNANETEGAPRVLFQIVEEMGNRGVVDTSSRLVSFHGEFTENIKKQVSFETGLLEEACIVDITKPRYQKAQNDMSSLLTKVGVSVINGLDSFLAVEMSWRVDVPVLWIIHESLSPYECYLGLDPWIRYRFYKALRVANRVAFVCEATRDLFQDFIGTERSVVIRNGLDYEAFCSSLSKLSRAEIRKNLSLAENDVMLLSVGTTTERKGQDRTLREFRIFLDRFPDTKARLFIVGARDIPYLDLLKSLTSELRLTDNVCFVPETPEVHQFYLAADLFILNSKQESSPLVILEAYASRLPVISTEVFGLKELLSHQERSLVFDGEEEGSLAGSIAEALFSEGLRQSMVEKGFEFLLTHCSKHQMVDAYEKEIKSLIESGVPNK